MNFSINTDDPSIFNTSFQNEIDLAKQTLQLNNDQIYEIMLNSLESSFASKKEKEKIKKILSNNWKKYLPQS
jgi:adenosine deaminase